MLLALLQKIGIEWIRLLGGGTTPTAANAAIEGFCAIEWNCVEVSTGCSRLAAIAAGGAQKS